MQIEITYSYFAKCTRWHIKRALFWLDPRDLQGIEVIKISDEPSHGTKEKEPLLYLRNMPTGSYVHKGKAHKAYIRLYPESLYLGLPLILKFTPLATLRVANTVAHEVGHHLIAYRGYANIPNEEYKSSPLGSEKREIAADSYAYSIIRKMSSKWYYRVSLKLCQILSDFYYDYGLVTWENHEYRRSAYYWACAIALNRDNSKAERAIAELESSKEIIRDSR